MVGTGVTPYHSNESIVRLPLDMLSTASWMLRPISNELVEELERSIKNIGLLQPIVVREIGEGYEIVFGNHRLRHADVLGWSTLAL